MRTKAAETHARLTFYLVGAYAVAVLAVMPFAYGPSEVAGFAAGVWAAPALIALACRKNTTLVDWYKWSALCLLTTIALLWAVGLTFQMNY